MHPFLDTSKLTDEELIQKLNQANSFLYMQHSLGHTPTVESIKEVIKSLEAERTTRMSSLAEQAFKKSGNNSIDIG